MDTLKDINFSKVYNYKNNDGKFCYINKPDHPFTIDIPVSSVAFNVESNKLVLNLIDPDFIDFVDQFNKMAIDYVYNKAKYIYGDWKTMDEIEKSYINPMKKAKYTSLKLKLNFKKTEPLVRNTKVSVKLHISGLWFSNDIFGPYFDVMDFDVKKQNSKNTCLFIEDPVDQPKIK